ncbi:hypothetical protein GYO_2897 [Bacillus spizizenii TU-B-10]|uniref:Uncharacterized protein n=1 Tax=Bacillus spizizenii (strain DSM 15029 / JCM 12233 / NBRC 101239 / NRRL B-23049 / TU-B-10) TaxID=1052585 RepID=G4NXR4_BACS4|nr:hypothetical protein GYO_2897 [Bacillus spizizenii TU-B-10]
MKKNLNGTNKRLLIQQMSQKKEALVVLTCLVVKKSCHIRQLLIF